jgi:hypothetical protein
LSLHSDSGTPRLPSYRCSENELEIQDWRP